MLGTARPIVSPTNATKRLLLAISPKPLWRCSLQIARFDFPGREAKEHAGQVTSITVANEVAQVLTGGAAKAR
jgi:hypothetical protein